jgi:hypothetical protein
MLSAIFKKLSSVPVMIVTLAILAASVDVYAAEYNPPLSASQTTTADSMDPCTMSSASLANVQGVGLLPLPQNPTENNIKVVAANTFQIPDNTSNDGSITYVVPASTFTGPMGQVYTFQVCVKTNNGASHGTTDYPAVYVGDQQVKPNANGNVQVGKALDYLTQDDQWTVYRTIFYLSDQSPEKNNPVYITLSTAGNTADTFSTYKNAGLFQGELPSVTGAIIQPKDDLLQGMGWFNMPAIGPIWDASFQPETAPPSLVAVKTPPKLPSGMAKAQAIEFNAPGNMVVTTGDYRSTFVPVSQVVDGAHYKMTYWIQNADGTKSSTSLCSNTLPYVSIDDHNGGTALQAQAITSLGTEGAWQQCQDEFYFQGALPDFPEVSMYWYKKSENPKGLTYQITGVRIPQLSTKKNTTLALPTQVPLISNFTQMTQGESLTAMVMKKNSTGNATIATWLIPKRTIGSSDQPGVLPGNLEIITNPDTSTDSHINGKPILRERFFGGDDSSGLQKAAGIDTSSDYAQERQGAGIVSNAYYASGIYVHCVQLPYDKYHPYNPKATPEEALQYSNHNTGDVSAFWPYLYQDLPQGAPGVNNEGGTIRNSELDWEIPGALEGSETDPSQPGGAFYGVVSYNNARLNVWGGQWSGTGNNFTGRPPQVGNTGSFQDLNNGDALNNGKFVQISYVIDGGGARPTSTSATQTHTAGEVAWYFNNHCALLDAMPSDISSDEPAQQRDILTKLIVGTRFAAMPGPGDLMTKLGVTNPILGTRVKLAHFQHPSFAPYVNQPAAGIFSGSDYGQDNIPYKPMRDWIAEWSPGKSGPDGYTVTSQSIQDPSQIYNIYWGWGGTPDFLHEPGVPGFLCDGKEIKTPGYKAWFSANAGYGDFSAACGSASTLLNDRLTFLQNMNKLPGGIRYVDPANPQMPGYLTINNDVPVACMSTDRKGCYTNERDEDIASIVILPLSMTNREDPTNQIDYQAATSNFVCIGQRGGDGPYYPAGCNPKDMNKSTGVAASYPAYHGSGPSTPSITWPAQPITSANWTGDTTGTATFTPAVFNNAPSGDTLEYTCGVENGGANEACSVSGNSANITGLTPGAMNVRVFVTVKDTATPSRVKSITSPSKGLLHKQVSPSITWPAQPITSANWTGDTTGTAIFTPAVFNNAPSGDTLEYTCGVENGGANEACSVSGNSANITGLTPGALNVRVFVTVKDTATPSRVKSIMSPSRGLLSKP